MNEKLPLAGYRVVELATVVAAPTAGRILADFGAEVIKIERPPDGDFLRTTGEAHQLPAEEDDNPLFDAFNSGKRLIALDLKVDEGKAVLFRLLERADVFISNTRPDALRRMGLDFNALHSRFPGLICAHLSGYGSRGPLRRRPGFDSTAFWMRTGAVTDWVTPGSFPVRPSFAFGDIATAAYFLNGILMALLAREKGAGGTLVETSLFGSSIWHNSCYVLNSQPQYGRPFPADRYDPWDPFGDYYLCRDGEWIATCKKDYDKDKHVFAALYDMPELVNDPDYGSIGGIRRSGKMPDCVKRIAAAVAEKTSGEWARIYEQNDIPFEVAHHLRDVCRDEQAWANEYLEKVPYPGGVETAMPTPPIRFSAYGRKSFQRQGPVGCDTDAVLGDLGYTDERLAELRERGVIR